MLLNTSMQYIMGQKQFTTVHQGTANYNAIDHRTLQYSRSKKSESALGRKVSSNAIYNVGELRWGRKYWASKREITSCVPDWRSPHYHQPWWQIDRTLIPWKIRNAKLSLSVSWEVEETTTVGAPSSGGEETLFEDKVSYNQLFWPFTQAFKAPNVVRWG